MYTVPIVGFYFFIECKIDCHSTVGKNDAKQNLKMEKSVNQPHTHKKKDK